MKTLARSTPMQRGASTASVYQSYVAPAQVRARMMSPKPNRNKNCPPASIVMILRDNRSRRADSPCSSSPGMGCGPKSSSRRTKKMRMIARTQMGRFMAKHHLQLTFVRAPRAIVSVSQGRGRGRSRSNHRQTSDHGTDTVAHPGGEAEDGPVLRVLLQADLVRQDHPHHHVQAGAPEALDAPAEEEDGKGVGGRAGAEGAADHHDHDGRLDGPVPAEDVGYLTPEGDEGGRG